MEYTKQNRLENYVERHRADFDPHEPRPELWAALEKQLPGGAMPTSEPMMSVAPNAAELGQQRPFTPAPRPGASSRRAWAERYGVAAALALLVLAAGLGEAWKSKRVAAKEVAARQVTSTPASAETDAALYLTPAGELGLSSVSQNMNARLDTAVRGMETYYVSQLADRKAELSQLAPDATADWARELVDLDSSYQRLKRELPRHPQPEVVLTAMNRNLQIRLDILDRQLELRGPDQTARSRESRGEFALADSRQTGETTLHHDH